MINHLYLDVRKVLNNLNLDIGKVLNNLPQAAAVRKMVNILYFEVREMVNKLNFDIWKMLNKLNLSPQIYPFKGAVAMNKGSDEGSAVCVAQRRCFASRCALNRMRSQHVLGGEPHPPKTEKEKQCSNAHTRLLQQNPGQIFPIAQKSSI